MQFRERREMAEFDGVLRTKHGEFPVSVRNVATNGLRLRGLQAPPDDPEATLLIKEHMLPGTIRWGKGEDVGFKLHQPLPPQLRAAILRRTRAPFSKRKRSSW